MIITNARFAATLFLAASCTPLVACSPTGDDIEIDRFVVDPSSVVADVGETFELTVRARVASNQNVNELSQRASVSPPVSEVEALQRVGTETETVEQAGGYRRTIVEYRGRFRCDSAGESHIAVSVRAEHHRLLAEQAPDPGGNQGLPDVYDVPVECRSPGAPDGGTDLNPDGGTDLNPDGGVQSLVGLFDPSANPNLAFGPVTPAEGSWADLGGPNVELGKHHGSHLAVRTIADNLAGAQLIDLESGERITPVTAPAAGPGWTEDLSANRAGTFVMVRHSGGCTVAHRLEDGSFVEKTVEGCQGGVVSDNRALWIPPDGEGFAQPLRGDLALVSTNAGPEISITETPLPFPGLDVFWDISPDGRCAVASGIDVAEGESGAGAGLYILFLIEGTATRITPTSAGAYSPGQVSRDCRTVTYSTFGGGMRATLDENGELIDGPERVLTTNDGSVPGPRPGGTAQDENGRYRVLCDDDCWVVDQWDGFAQKLTRGADGMSAMIGSCDQPRISPTGVDIAMACTASNLPGGVPTWSVYGSPNPLYEERALSGTACHPTERRCTDDLLSTCPTGEVVTAECATSCRDEGTAVCLPAKDRVQRSVLVDGDGDGGLLWRSVSGGPHTFEVMPPPDRDARVWLCRADGTDCVFGGTNLDEVDEAGVGGAESLSRELAPLRDYLVGVAYAGGAAAESTLVVTGPVSCTEGEPVCDGADLGVCSDTGTGPTPDAPTSCARGCSESALWGSGCVPSREANDASAEAPQDLGELAMLTLHPVEGSLAEGSDEGDAYTFRSAEGALVDVEVRNQPGRLHVRLFDQQGDTEHLIETVGNALDPVYVPPGEHFVTIEPYPGYDAPAQPYRVELFLTAGCLVGGNCTVDGDLETCSDGSDGAIVMCANPCTTAGETFTCGYITDDEPHETVEEGQPLGTLSLNEQYVIEGQTLNVDAVQDVDWFVFTLAASATMTFRTETSLLDQSTQDPALLLWDITNGAQVAADDDGAGNLHALIEQTLPPGEYGLLVYSAVLGDGPYRVVFQGQ